MDKSLLENLQRAVSLNPRFAEGYFAIGNIFREKNNLSAALSSYQRAITANPRFESSYLAVVEILLSLGQLEEAIAVSRKALTASLNSSSLYLNLGRALMDKNLNADAIACLERAVALDATCAEAYGRLGHLFAIQCRISDGIAALQRAVALLPQSSRLPYYLFQAFHRAGKLTEAINYLRQSITLNSDNIETHTALLGTLLYSPLYSREEAFADRAAFGERFEVPLRKKWRPTKPINPQKRLRVGFVSGDLLSHPVGYFIEGVLRELRKLDRIDIIVYSTNSVVDAITDRLRAEAHSWTSVVTLSDDAFAERIRGDNIDILVDLSGHTTFNRLLVFARKPARIQVTWLGDCATTGLKAIDYILCDPHGVQDDESKFYVEKAWFLPHTRLCFTPPDEVIPVAPLPALSAGYVTFGCFNNLIKMNDSVVAAWARILSRVKNAQLMLKSLSFYDPQVCHDVIARFATHGITPDRLLLKLASSREEYFADYNLVDIALDPFPFTGGTTSVDGIWMGVPMLTKRGDSICSRQGEGILHNLALQNWIASDEDDYVELAVRHAGDISSLSLLRSQLRAKLESSPLCNAKLFAQDLENAFMQMSKKYNEAFFGMRY